MAEKKTVLELFEAHAASKSEAKRVYNLVSKYDLLSLNLDTLLSIKGLGRRAALLCVEVAADLKKKK